MSLLLLLRGTTQPVVPRRPQLSPHKKLQKIRDARRTLGHARVCGKASGFTARLTNPAPALSNVFRAPVAIEWLPIPIPEPRVIEIPAKHIRALLSGYKAQTATHGFGLRNSGRLCMGMASAQATSHEVSGKAGVRHGIPSVRAATDGYDIGGHAIKDYSDEYAMLMAALVD